MTPTVLSLCPWFLLLFLPLILSPQLFKPHRGQLCSCAQVCVYKSLSCWPDFCRRKEEGDVSSAPVDSGTRLCQMGSSFTTVSMVTELSPFEGRETQGLERSAHLIQNIWPEVNMEILHSLSLAYLSQCFDGSCASGLVATKRGLSCRFLPPS